MATTHALVGTLVGLALAPLAPAEAGTVALSGALGGLAPDLDALGDHRKDLHFPVYGALVTGLLIGLAVLVQTTWLVATAAFLASATVHAVSDAFGGGRSLRPWAESVDRAVYCHAQNRWWRPRAWIPYDGSPADFAVATGLCAVVLVAPTEPGVRVFALTLLAISVPYVLLRKRLPDYVDRFWGVVGATSDRETWPGRGR